MGGVFSSVVDYLLSTHKPLGLITSTTRARVVDRHLLGAAQHRADLSFWDGLGMVLPKRETPWKVFPSQAFYAAKLGAPTTASGMSKGAALNILWLDLRLLAPDICGKNGPAHIACRGTSPPSNHAGGTKEELLAICWWTWVMCAAEVSPELPTEHRLTQTFQVALALNQESCSEPTTHSPLKTPCKCKHSVR